MIKKNLILAFKYQIYTSFFAIFHALVKEMKEWSYVNSWNYSHLFNELNMIMVIWSKNSNHSCFGSIFVQYRRPYYTFPFKATFLIGLFILFCRKIIKISMVFFHDFNCTIFNVVEEAFVFHEPCQTGELYHFLFHNQTSLMLRTIQTLQIPNELKQFSKFPMIYPRYFLLKKNFENWWKK